MKDDGEMEDVLRPIIAYYMLQHIGSRLAQRKNTHNWEDKARYTRTEKYESA